MNMTQVNKILLSVFFLTGISLGVFNLLRDNPSAKIEPAQAQSEAHATFGVVGDIMLSRNVAAKIKKANNPLLPFSNMRDILLANDFNFANLESPFSGKDSFPNTGSLVFNVPRANVKGLVENKFKILSLANNHAMDQRLKGLIYTRTYLGQNNIKTIGAGSNLDEAWRPDVVEANGIKIGFIAASYSSINDNAKSTNQYVARIEDVSRLKGAIAAAKKQADFVVVSMHAGTEYKYKPNDSQTKFARAAIDLGADLVVGAHPHWVQTIEKYNGKYIFYSLGNFIFDQEWSRETKEGLMLKVELAQAGKNGVMQTRLDQIELLPVVVENYSTPRLANDQEANVILKHIGIQNRVLR
jgi:poly-gamma-glutamate synthesis protein (capsule biosynthesis protein)